MAFGLKLLLYNTLVHIVNAGAKTPGEREFLKNMREYVRQANIKVAEATWKLYQEWKSGEDRRKSRMGRAGNHPYVVALDIPVPPDFENIAMQSMIFFSSSLVRKWRAISTCSPRIPDIEGLSLINKASTLKVMSFIGVSE